MLKLICTGSKKSSIFPFKASVDLVLIKSVLKLAPEHASFELV